jgi:hypothetical protein
MHDDTNPGDDSPVPSGLERRLGALSGPPVPDDLLERCLATVPVAARGAPARSRRPIRWAVRGAAAALLLIGIGSLVGRPKHADAASQLKAVRAAWAAVPAAHLVIRHTGTGGTRTEEAWFARDKGRRREVRSGDELTLVVVNNRRWEFRWDVRARAVAAWSAELVGPGSPAEDARSVLGSTEFLRWAESQAAAIRIETVTIAGREARKAVVRWPGPAQGTSMPRDQTVWFDPSSLLPLRQRLVYGDGRVEETTFDFPAPGSVPDDLFAFRPPPGLVLEINDPDLGRRIVTETRKGDER